MIIESKWMYLDPQTPVIKDFIMLISKVVMCCITLPVYDESDLLPLQSDGVPAVLLCQSQLVPLYRILNLGWGMWFVGIKIWYVGQILLIFCFFFNGERSILILVSPPLWKPDESAVKWITKLKSTLKLEIMFLYV